MLRRLKKFLDELNAAQNRIDRDRLILAQGCGLDLLPPVIVSEKLSLMLEAIKMVWVHRYHGRTQINQM